MKKILALVLSVLLLAALPVAASAHGHHGRSAAKTRYPLCTVENCNVVGIHQHDGTFCSGHFIGDGHDYHQACTVEGCTETACHEHGGTVCLPHSGGSGRGHHSGHRSGCHY